MGFGYAKTHGFLVARVTLTPARSKGALAWGGTGALTKIQFYHASRSPASLFKRETSRASNLLTIFKARLLRWLFPPMLEMEFYFIPDKRTNWPRWNYPLPGIGSKALCCGWRTIFSREPHLGSFMSQGDVFPDKQIFNICFLEGELAKTNFNIQRFFKEDILWKEIRESQTDSTNIPQSVALAGHSQDKFFPLGGFSYYLNSKGDFQSPRFPK